MEIITKREISPKKEMYKCIRKSKECGSSISNLWKKIPKAVRRMKEEGEIIRKHRSAIGMLSK
jgi:hypothetical protein